MLLLCLLAVPVQMQLAGAIAVAGLRPDLPGVAVYGAGLMLGPWAGGLAGVLVGLLTDQFSAGPIGPQLAAKLVIGLVSGLLSGRLRLTSLSAQAGVLLLLFFLQGLWMTAALAWRTGEGWSALWFTALPEACYTSIIVLGGLWLSQRWWRIGDDGRRLALQLDR